jgi:hypothetical protein
MFMAKNKKKVHTQEDENLENQNDFLEEESNESDDPLQEDEDEDEDEDASEEEHVDTWAEVFKKMAQIATSVPLTDLSLPKEIISQLGQGAKNTKDDFIKNLKSPLKEFLSKIDVSKELGKILENYEIQLEGKVTFKPKSKDKVDEGATKSFSLSSSSKQKNEFRE